jgi:hypothetical protein
LNVVLDVARFQACLWPCNLRFDDAGLASARLRQYHPRPMNVEICASKVVADYPSASAPQQGNTQMACIATLVGCE